MPSETVPIFFTIDNGYVPYLSVAISSMVRNAAKDRHYSINVISNDITQENKEILRTLVNEDFDITFLPVSNSASVIGDCPGCKLRCDFFTLTIYYRIFIPEMFPQYDKAIYIDSDIVVPGDISRLYDTDLGDHLLGVCTDASIGDIPPLVYYVENAIGKKFSEYFNSGVLLMNMKALRQKKLSENFLNLLNTYHFDSIAPDQDYLNAMCCGQVLFLDRCWDAMPNKAHPQQEDPMLIHYNLFDKPWCYDDVQYEDYFWRYARKSPFYKQIIDSKAAYGQAQKDSDKKCLNEMISRALSIPDTDVNFRKMYAAGKKIRL